MMEPETARLAARRAVWLTVWRVELAGRIVWAAGRWALGVVVLGVLLGVALYFGVSVLYFIHATLANLAPLL